MLGRIDTPQVNIGDFFVFFDKKTAFLVLERVFFVSLQRSSINQASRTSKFRESLGH